MRQKLKIMDCDELVDQLLELQDATADAAAVNVALKETRVPAKTVLSGHHKRLVEVAAGGQDKQYFGRLITADKVS